MVLECSNSAYDGTVKLLIYKSQGGLAVNDKKSLGGGKRLHHVLLYPKIESCFFLAGDIN